MSSLSALHVPVFKMFKRLDETCLSFRPLSQSWGAAETVLESSWCAKYPAFQARACLQNRRNHKNIVVSARRVEAWRVYITAVALYMNGWLRELFIEYTMHFQCRSVRKLFPAAHHDASACARHL